MGGFVRMKVLQVRSCRFGSAEYDGLIGYPALRYFTVMLDYKDGMIYLQPGSLLRSQQKATPPPTPQPQAT